MGMDAELVAIGKYAPELAHFMDYPISFYNKVKRGERVIATVIVCNSSAQSMDLAAALGANAYDLSTHFIKPGNINWTTLEENFGALYANKIKVFVEREFQLIFRPNM